MAALLENVDPEGLLEYSVVYTDRALNHMSKEYKEVMCDISSMLKEVYNAREVALVPGGGTYAMEAVVRQFGKDANALIIRNGWFSYRWSQIFEAGDFSAKTTVCMARQVGNGKTNPFAPPSTEEIVATIKKINPDIVFAPHVETSTGMILPDDYIRSIANAAHEVGALLVLDCIASGCLWTDMEKTGVDVLITATQKGWSSSPCAGITMMSERALKRLEDTSSGSFALDLKQWLSIMKAYENGGFAYHATMPTDSIRSFRDTIMEMKAYGFDKLSEAQWELGNKVRELLKRYGMKSVTSDMYGSPGVVVCYTADPNIQNGRKFAEQGMQIAAGVPLACNEPDGFMTFRIGLFGLDKLYDVDAAVARLEKVLEKAFN